MVVKVSPPCVYVVDANRHPGHEPRLPCDTPDTAFTNIQEAVDYLPPGKTVYVDEGEYAVTSNVSVTKDINVISLKGPAATTIVRHPSVKSRLLYVSSPNAMVSGFTFKNGWLNVRNNDGSAASLHRANAAPCSNCVVTAATSTPHVQLRRRRADGNGTLSIAGFASIRTSHAGQPE